MKPSSVTIKVTITDDGVLHITQITVNQKWQNGVDFTKIIFLYSLVTTI
jgi:hypothetical protein